MAHMTDLDSFRKLSYYSDFESRRLSVSKFLETIFGPVPISPLNFEPSVNNENWPRFNNISGVHFTVVSPLVPCVLFSVDVKPTGVIKLFCHHPNLAWVNVTKVTIISSRRLTNITEGPQYAVTRNFTNSIQGDMDFRHCLPLFCFTDQVVTSCMGLLIKWPWFILLIRRSAAALLSLY